MLIEFVWAGSLFAAAFVSTWYATSWLLRFRERVGIWDVPNARSLHTSPTPRGGGAAIALCVSVLQVSLGAFYSFPKIWLAAWTVAAGLLAIVGWCDDRRNVSMLIRLAVQLSTISILLALVTVTSDWPVTLLSVIVAGLVLVLMVWLINLFNFMDGSDGLAGTQAFSAALIGGILALAQGEQTIAMIAFAIAGASAGFLRWNWSPAKIFMGDAGSYFLGAQFACLTLFTYMRTHSGYWLILLAPFVTDATLTLVRRILTVPQWYIAHKTHVYQRAIQTGRGHADVARMVGAYVLFIAAPAAWYSVEYPALAVAVTLAVYALTVTIWLFLLYRTRRERTSIHV